MFISIDVSALSFSSTSVRTAYWYENGTLSDSGFVTTNPRNLPQYGSSATGYVSMRLYQWRYSTSSALSTGRYKIATDITFSSVDGIDIDNFLNGEISEIRCGTTYSNASEDNLTLIDYEFRKESDTKFQFNYTIDVLSTSCSLFSGIVKWGDNEYTSEYTVNNSTSTNETLSFYVSYKEIEVLNNQEIIDSLDKNTNDIIENDNQNTQDIIDSQDKINDSLTDDNVETDDATGFFDDFTTEDNGGISGIVTAPLTMINSLLQTGTCTDLSFSILGKDVYLPCGSILWNLVPSAILIVYQTIVCGYFSYILLKSLFKDIEKLKNPNNSEVSTLDL